MIGPWNYPIYTPNGSIAYALAAGNTVVYKPSEFSTTIGNFIAQAFAEANPELPAGVFITINGYGATGAALVPPAWTRSRSPARAAPASRSWPPRPNSLTPVLLECGGKDAVIVAADADIKAAADAVAYGATMNSGQTCAGVERVYVDKSIRDKFVAEVKKVLSDIHPGSDAKACYGPMTMPSQIDIVRRHIEDALKNGGTAVHRRPRLDQGRVHRAGGAGRRRRGSDGRARGDLRPDGHDPHGRRHRRGDRAGQQLDGIRWARRCSPASTASRSPAVSRPGATSVNSVLGFAAISALPFGGRRGTRASAASTARPA